METSCLRQLAPFADEWTQPTEDELIVFTSSDAVSSNHLGAGEYVGDIQNTPRWKSQGLGWPALLHGDPPNSVKDAFETAIYEELIAALDERTELIRSEDVDSQIPVTYVCSVFDDCSSGDPRSHTVHHYVQNKALEALDESQVAELENSSEMEEASGEMEKASSEMEKASGEVEKASGEVEKAGGEMEEAGGEILKGSGELEKEASVEKLLPAVKDSVAIFQPKVRRSQEPAQEPVSEEKDGTVLPSQQITVAKMEPVQHSGCGVMRALSVVMAYLRIVLQVMVAFVYFLVAVFTGDRFMFILRMLSELSVEILVTTIMAGVSLLASFVVLLENAQSGRFSRPVCPGVLCRRPRFAMSDRPRTYPSLR